MARIIGGLAVSHTPTIGFAVDHDKQSEAAWAPIFEGFEPIKVWLEEQQHNPRRQKRARRFVQMTAQFWHMTQPQSSKKQWPLLQDLFEPSALSTKYWHYLTQVV